MLMLPCGVGFGHADDVSSDRLQALHVVVVVLSGVAVGLTFHVVKENSDVFFIPDHVGISIRSVDVNVGRFSVVLPPWS